jgi:site-specific recombinase XerD
MLYPIALRAHVINHLATIGEILTACLSRGGQMANRVSEFITERQYLKNVTPRTISWYRQSFKAFDGAMESKAAMVGRITELRQRGVSAITVNTYLRCVNAYFRWQHIEHEETLIRIPRLQTEQKIIATLSGDQIKRLLHFKPKGANATRAHMLAAIILDCGLRISEALTLSWDHTDLDNLCLKVKGKGSKERIVPVSMELRRLLFRWRQRQKGPLVVSTRTGTRMSVRNVQRDLKALFGRIGITGVRCSPHTLRHTFSICYLRNGGNLFYLSKILGHTSVKTTERYLQSVQPKDLAEVHDRLSALSEQVVGVVFKILGARPCPLLSRIPKLLPFEPVILASVLELLFYSLAHYELPVVRIYRKVAAVEQSVQVTPEQQAIRDFMTLNQGVRFDMSRL